MFGKMGRNKNNMSSVQSLFDNENYMKITLHEKYKNI
jgi:hypothetical protein